MQMPTASQAPVVDDDGLLRFGGQWVAFTETQIPVVELLVARFGTLVRNEDLLAAYAAGGGSTSAATLHPLIYRLRRRLASVGLTLHVVRRRGVLLDVTA
jgi:DNA-binding winged helix-turn-helix (wHTH) protein